jgi:hypothetical protein
VLLAEVERVLKTDGSIVAVGIVFWSEVEEYFALCWFLMERP